MTIKNARDKPDFRINPYRFRDKLIANEFLELHITSDHALAVASLPPIHKDPFDRILIAPATHEGITLLTSDTLLAQYPGPILLVEPVAWLPGTKCPLRIDHHPSYRHITLAC